MTVFSTIEWGSEYHSAFQIIVIACMCLIKPSILDMNLFHTRQILATELETCALFFSKVEICLGFERIMHFALNSIWRGGRGNGKKEGLWEPNFRCQPTAAMNAGKTLILEVWVRRSRADCSESGRLGWAIHLNHIVSWWPRWTKSSAEVNWAN